MFNGSKKPQRADQPKGSFTEKPIVLSSKRYERIVNNACHKDKLNAQKEAKEEYEYRQFLKKGNDELVAKFPSKRLQNKNRVAEQLKQAKTSYNELKENEEQVRRQKIAKAQQLVEKLKPGPRDLRSAALASEVLRARNVQRTINDEFSRAKNRQDLEDNKSCAQQAMPFMVEEERRTAQFYKRHNDIKHELLQTINHNTRKRNEDKRKVHSEQMFEREKVDQEIKDQIEKERAIMEKKKAVLRQNALEAMKMVEQRRLRDRMTDELENRLCCVYNAGKHQLDGLKSNLVKDIAAEREKGIEANANSLAVKQQDIQALESARIRRDISHMQLKFTAEEQEKLRKEKAAKRMRIEAYLEEVEQQKQAQLRASEEKMFDVAQRFKNMEVNCRFDEAQKFVRMRKVEEVEAQLKAQTQQKIIAERERKAAEKRADKVKKYNKQDEFFFDYARNLMEDAHKKNRPLHPFAKVVNDYKHTNNIGFERTKTPRHLVSHLTVGVRQPGDSKSDDKLDETHEESASGTPKCKADKDNILKNCLKINELLVSSAADGNLAECIGQNPIKSFQPRARNEGGEDGADSLASQSSAKLRYSLNELRTLNQFSAPSLH